MTTTPTIVWLRNDLRLEDNAALIAAVQRGGPVVPLYVWAPHEHGDWGPGAASRWWLHYSLQELDRQLGRLGSRLIVRQGDSLAALREIVRATQADAVFWNRRYEPALASHDARVQRELERDRVQCATFNGSLLFEPWEVATKQGKPFQVYTAFWRATGAAREPAAPEGAPPRLPAPPRWPGSLPIDQLGLLPALDWAVGFHARWRPGCDNAAGQLGAFLDQPISRYGEDRNRPDRRGSSRLSPHLHFGEISPRVVWHAISQRLAAGADAAFEKAAEAYRKELVWREFAHHLLHHFPGTVDKPLREEFELFPWAEDARAERAWQRGRTGFPLVDAGMRELWKTGWMHNRARMVVASFLVKDLLIPWQSGARWFWDTLVDADLAANTMGWQWTAGCGADAAPYFRVFNPVLQGERYDPEGGYVRRWVPELADLPSRWIHKPWAAPADVLRDARVEIDHSYPSPIVDHGAARQRALAAYDVISLRGGPRSMREPVRGSRRPRRGPGRAWRPASTLVGSRMQPGPGAAGHGVESGSAGPW